MSRHRAVIFDLETVPDLSAGRGLLQVEAETSDAELRQMLGQRYAKAGEDPETAFVKAPLQKIVCIGALYAELTDNGAWTVVRSGVGHIGVRPERELIERFIESLGGVPSPQLVGFNSSGFDLPVLRYRAFSLAIPAQVLHGGNGKDYWYRYGRDHIDVCDFISGFGASPKPSLSELASLCGLPAKIRGVDGLRVEAIVSAGRLEDLSAYCETDVYVTYFIFLRLALVTGWISESAFEGSLEHLSEHIADRLPKRPHLQIYLDALCAKTNVAEPLGKSNEH